MSDPAVSPRAARSRAGFTLLELVVVIAILAATAGLLISRIDWIRRSADSATSVAGIAQVQNSLQLYKTMKSVYPDRFDSLLDSTTTGSGGTGALYGKLWQVTHPNPENFVVSSIAAPPPGPPAGVAFSLNHVGITKVLDHSPLTAFPGDSGAAERDVEYPSAVTLVTVKAHSTLEKSIYPGYFFDANGDGTNDNGSDGLPLTKPANVTLVALGVGAGCTSNGATTTGAPMCSAVDPALHYPRYIAIFACYADGSRADLKTVVDPLGQVASAQLKNYYSNVPQ